MSKQLIKKICEHDWFSKLTEAEKQIWCLIYYHPTFIRNRVYALDMLFCVIGTGLGWKDGQIIDNAEDNYLTAKEQDIYNLDKDIYHKAYINTFNHSSFDDLKKWNIKCMREYCYHENSIAEYTLKNIEKAVTISFPSKSFYPLCQYSNLMTVPENVRQDWLALAIETCDLILVTDPLYRCSNGILQNKDNIRLAKQQKTKLLKMKEQK